MAAGKLQQPSAERIADEIAHLRDLDASTLRLRWREVTGKAAAPGLKGELLVRALAYAIQEQTFGGLSLAATKRLQAIAREGTASKDGSPRERRSAAPPRRLMPGTRLVREWQGVLHEVIVIPGGFLWRGATYPSLSTVAKAITGTSWNGWVFFGAKPATKRIKPVGSDQSSRAAMKPAIDTGGSDAHA
jgi:hypothetical protein